MNCIHKASGQAYELVHLTVDDRTSGLTYILLRKQGTEQYIAVGMADFINNFSAQETLVTHNKDGGFYTIVSAEVERPFERATPPLLLYRSKSTQSLALRERESFMKFFSPVKL